MVIFGPPLDLGLDALPQNKFCCKSSKFKPKKLLSAFKDGTIFIQSSIETVIQIKRTTWTVEFADCLLLPTLFLANGLARAVQIALMSNSNGLVTANYLQTQPSRLHMPMYKVYIILIFIYSGLKEEKKIEQSDQCYDSQSRK